MLVQPWDAGLDDAEWQTWIAEGHDFGQLSVNGLPGHPPVAVPTHFTGDGQRISLIHLARPNPVWKAIEHDPNVLFTVFGDYAFIPGPWRASAGTPPTDGVPTSYYTAVQFTGRAQHRRRPRGQGRAAAPPARPLPARRRPRPRRRRPAALRPDAARHPRPAPASHRRTGQVQVRRPQARRTPHRRRRPPHRARPGPRPAHGPPAAPPPGPHRHLEAVTARRDRRLPSPHPAPPAARPPSPAHRKRKPSHARPPHRPRRRGRLPRHSHRPGHRHRSPRP